MRRVCNDAKDETVFFGSQLSSITEHQFRPTMTVEQKLATHSMDDAIWDNINPCDVSLDNMSGTEDFINVDGTKESNATATTLTSNVMTKYSTTPMKHLIHGTMSQKP